MTTLVTFALFEHAGFLWTTRPYEETRFPSAALVYLWMVPSAVLMRLASQWGQECRVS